MGDNGPGVGDALDGAPPEAGAVQAEGRGQDAGSHVVLAAQSNCKKIDYHYYVSRGPVLLQICLNLYVSYKFDGGAAPDAAPPVEPCGGG